ncbi:hypothetical protein JD276_09490 [Leucobacter sp. CSA1]|uniref:DUF559 domain-containing protein n=1 Tax=Leucobacter chromiisoli TaxID=2796471 RepID=A0A934Q6K8_9MICO|nr:hypothetical protein [Leucobacter chromiisoli]MBK0419265.1 hypothetical protein [Leucobacter chromiisoli]
MRVAEPENEVESAPENAPENEGVRAVPARGRFDAALDRELELIRALAERAIPGQFFVRRSAALLHGMPMPHLDEPELHLGVLLPARAPRVAGVVGHALSSHRCSVETLEGIPLTSAASTWVMLGDLTVHELVAAGDSLIRVHRPGYGRPNAGKPPLTTLEELSRAVGLGRWRGMGRLRRALTLVRRDAWSPMESVLRVSIVLAGLPEPELNVDLFDDRGVFLGCFDLVYRRYRIAIEYQGVGHADRYAQDVERIARLRAEGWIVIEVTKALMSDRTRVIARIRAALCERGFA